MHVSLVNRIAAKANYDVLFIPVKQGLNLKSLLQELKGKCDFSGLSDIMHYLENESFTGKAGQNLSLTCYTSAPFRRLVLLGLGEAKDAQAYRKIGAFASRMLQGLQGSFEELSRSGKVVNNTAGVFFSSTLFQSAGRQSRAKSVALVAVEPACEAFLEAMGLADFTFKRYKTVKLGKAETAALSTLKLQVLASGVTSAHFAALNARAQAFSRATNFARELVAEPPSVMTPSRLAQEARKIAKEGGLAVKVLDAAQAEKLGMGAFLGVARGADEPAKFISLKYTAGQAKKTVAIIGKGITFDSGGLSLKPAASMEHMKYDMSGAACVLATMQAIAQLKPRVNVLAIVPACENMPGSAALHPGDVLQAMNGKTIEVNNTDAEGRLVLADALTYAINNGADQLIDIATLTGAVVTALGRACAGIMGSNQELIDSLMMVGSETGEKFWQLPLFDEYKDYLKSDIADLKNAGARGEAGSSAAGMFLREFTQDKPWAHLDVAGVSWLEREKDEWCKGGTGFAVRTLAKYLLQA